MGPPGEGLRARAMNEQPRKADAEINRLSVALEAAQSQLKEIKKGVTWTDDRNEYSMTTESYWAKGFGHGFVSMPGHLLGPDVTEVDLSETLSTDW